MRHVNIPIFIPHLGCPNQCVFCNQRSISGRTEFHRESVRDEIENALATVEEDAEVEIAFFGGSFTGIDRDLMVYLLSLAKEYIDKGKVQSIRLSTRPDYIDDEILDILGEYGVKTVELGLQSMSDEVLKISKRGHDSSVADAACKKIKERGFALVGQMMIGLPGSDIGDEIATAEKICQMGADAARVYPTVVFYHTELCEMAQRGEYAPLSLEEAAERSAKVLAVFDGHNIPCIRVGLCASENLSSEDEVYGGPNHSAIGEMAMSRVFLEKIKDKIERSEMIGKADSIRIFVPQGATSKAVGQKKQNVVKIREKYGFKNVKILEKNSLIGYNIEVEIY